MTIALVQTSPPTLLQVYQQGPVNVNIPGLWQAQDVDAGWSSPDGAYKLVAVAPVTVPLGQVLVSTSYSWDGTTVTAAPVFAAAPLNIIPYSVWISRFTAAEYALLLQKRAQAITVGPTAIGLIQQMDQVAATNVMDLNNALSQTVKAAMVTAGMLTQARADAIFS